MGVWARRSIVGVLVASWPTVFGGDAVATPLFTSPPHFLSLHDRSQLVFFVNEDLVGALATRAADGVIDVTVPEAIVDPTLEGAKFSSDEWPGLQANVSVRSVEPKAGSSGGVGIRIEPGMPVAAVDAYSVEDPPRLIVELLSFAPTPAPEPTPASSRGSAAAAKPRASTSASATGSSRAQASLSVTTTATPSPNTPPASTATPTVTTSPTVHKSPVPPLATAAPTLPKKHGAESGVEVVSGATAAGVSLPCRLLRSSGLSFCAPDPHALPYAADSSLAALATAVGEGEAVLPELRSDVEGPAALYLTADREFVRGAPRRRLLAAVDAYRRALRRYPAFFDAPRARLNIALAYAGIGLGVELEAAAAANDGDPGQALALALVGDAAVARGDFDLARRTYQRIAAGGGLGRCLAARGGVRLALANGFVEEAVRGFSALAGICPALLLDDPDTEWLRARVRLANGDAAVALRILSTLRDAFGRAGAAAVLEDIAAAAVAAGDDETAQRAYDDLLGGGHGTRAAARAVVQLARLDAAAGDFAAAMRKLDALPPVEAGPERHRLALQAVTAALRRGDDAEAVATLHQHAITPTELSPTDQVRLAASYRAFGLSKEGERLLMHTQASVGPAAPDALWEELGAIALARGDTAEALATVDQWLRANGGEPPSRALALRARALASSGDTAEAVALVSGRLAESDPVLARDLRIEIATAIRSQDPAAAAELLTKALASTGLSELPAATAAAAWRALGEAAEEVGDHRTALEAFTRLAARYGDQANARGAAYRVARLTAAKPGGAAAAAYAQAAESGDAVERRVAMAAHTYEVIVAPLRDLAIAEEQAAGEESQ